MVAGDLTLFHIRLIRRALQEEELLNIKLISSKSGEPPYSGEMKAFGPATPVFLQALVFPDVMQYLEALRQGLTSIGLYFHATRQNNKSRPRR